MYYTHMNVNTEKFSDVRKRVEINVRQYSREYVRARTIMAAMNQNAERFVIIGGLVASLQLINDCLRVDTASFVNATITCLSLQNSRYNTTRGYTKDNQVQMAIEKNYLHR